MQRRTTLVFVWTLLITLAMTQIGLAKTLEKEKELHYKAWSEVAERARNSNQYKYALYASRSLAVKHPELYLQGDVGFNKQLRSLRNMGLFYTTRSTDLDEIHDLLVDDFNTIPRRKKNRFLWDDFDLNDHHEVSYSELYRDAFLFPFVDLRLPLLGTSLLGWDYQATPLALAQMLYFQLDANKKVRQTYLLVSECGNAYVASFDRSKNLTLLDHRGVEKEPQEKIVLIFNHKYVWYPLMDRDDTGRDKYLSSLVSSYASPNPLPELTQEEIVLVEMLREATGMGQKKDRNWMSVMASRLHARSWGEAKEIQKIYPQWADIRSSHAPGPFTYELAYIHRISNRLSPATSHLAAFVAYEHENYETPYDYFRFDYALMALSKKYNLYMGVKEVLFPWWYHPELHFLNIDDSVLSKRAN